MSKRYGGKKRKSPKRVRAGKKAWRKRVARYGSKAAAVAASFGRRGRRKKGRKKGRKATHRFSRANMVLRRIAYDKALARVQAKLKTTGQAPTAREKKIAARIVRDVGGRRGPTMSSEERNRLRFKEKLAQDRRREAARRVAYDLKVRAEQERRAKHDAAQKAAEAAINAEMSNL